MADRLLYAAVSPASLGVAETTFTLIDWSGLLFPIDALRRTVQKPRIQLMAWLTPPVGGSIEVIVAIQQDTVKIDQLSGTIIRATAPAAGPAAMKVAGGVVELADKLKGDMLALRLMARVTTGVGTIDTPTIALLGPA